MFDTPYNRKIAQQIQAINQKYIDDSDAKEQLYDQVIPSFKVTGGRGNRKVYREESMDENMAPNIIPAKKRGRKPKNMDGAGWMDTLSKVANISGQVLDTAKKAVPIAKDVSGIIRKAKGGVMSAGAMSAGAMSAGRRKGGVMSAGAMSAGVMSAGGFGDMFKNIKSALKFASPSGGAMASNFMEKKRVKPAIYYKLNEERGLGGVMSAGARKYKKGDYDLSDMEGSGFMDSLRTGFNAIGKVVPVAIKGYKLAKEIKGSGKLSPKQRGALVSAYMKSHGVTLGEASKAVSAYHKGEHNKLSGGAFKWLKHAFQKVGKVAETVGSDAYNLAKQGAQTAISMAPMVAQTVAQNPELLAMAV
jgi:hypothetical protein